MHGKIVRQPFPYASTTPISANLGLVHADMWGPVRVPTLGGKARYVLILVDQATDMVWAFPLQDKESSTVKTTLEKWRVAAERQAGAQLKVLRTDNGLEFEGEVQQWIQQLGITHQRSAPYSPQQNGKVERWHRTMAEGIRTLLLACGLPVGFWGEALRHIVWVKNRTAHRALAGCTTPIEAWTGRKPDVSMLRVWGSMGCVRLHEPEQQQQGKLGPKGVMCVCLGVDDDAKAWRMFDPQVMKVRITRNVDFMEQVPWKQWQAGRTGGKLAVDSAESVLQLLPPFQQLPGAPRDEL